MGETITTKGKTVKEALDLALTILNKEQSEVDIEVLKQEEKGFLGLMSKPAVVKVTVKQSESKEVEVTESINNVLPSNEINEFLDSSLLEENETEIRNIDLEGKAWVIDGKCIVRILKINIH